MDRKRGFAIRRALMPSAERKKESTKKDSCVDSWTWPLAQDDGTSEHARHSVPAHMGAATPIPNSRAQPEHPAVLAPHVPSCQPSCHPRSSHSHALPHPPPPSVSSAPPVKTTPTAPPQRHPEPHVPAPDPATSSVSSANNAQAQKHCKYAISALQFDGTAWWCCVLSASACACARANARPLRVPLQTSRRP
jgi:hypothetical protein